jgi:hypothetical protein
MPISRALLGIWFGVSSKGALHPDSPLRGALFPEPFFIDLSVSAVYDPSSKFHSGPLWRDMPISRAFTYPSGSPVKKNSSRFPSQSSYRERFCVSRTLFQLYKNFPVNRTLQFFQMDPMGGDAHLSLQIPLLHISSW